MTLETLQEAVKLKAEIDKWQSRVDMVERDYDRISMSFQNGSISGSYTLPPEEKTIVIDALRNYYLKERAAAQKAFGEFKNE